MQWVQSTPIEAVRERERAEKGKDRVFYSHDLICAHFDPKYHKITATLKLVESLKTEK